MTRFGLYLHAARTIRRRQAVARLLRPLRRRRFPGGLPPRRVAPVTAAATLWRSAAFAEGDRPNPGTRLGQFHAQYGDDVLAAARAGEVDRAHALLERWIDEHPARPGDPWHPYPLSTRVGNWIAALTLEPALGSERVSVSLWHQLGHLRGNVEDDILGNHVIRNARALVLGGVAFADDGLLRHGLDLLTRELPEQVLPDGGHYERSPVYQLVVLRDLLEVQAAVPRSDVGEAIERMRAWSAAVRRPDGHPPLVNDGWLDAVPVLELPVSSAGVTALRDSGLALVREDGLWLAFRCGPLAPAFLPAHAHADALGFQLWWDGLPVVVDPGTFTYEAGPERDAFRGTAAHAALRVDGRDQFEPWGAFRAGPLPQTRLLAAEPGLLVAEAELGGGIVQRREIAWTAAEVTVDDHVSGPGRHRLEWALPLAPGARARVSITPEPSVTDAGWLSERLGERVEIEVLRYAYEGPLPARQTLRLRRRA